MTRRSGGLGGTFNKYLGACEKKHTRAATSVGTGACCEEEDLRLPVSKRNCRSAAIVVENCVGEETFTKKGMCCCCF